MATIEAALATTREMAKQLGQDRPALTKLNEYYLGKHPLAFASERFEEAFGGMFKAFADNWCPLVVDALRQRLHVTGFQFSIDKQDNGEGDRAAWDMWQANNMDADSDILHTDALVYGRAYVVVGLNDPDAPVAARMTVESPLNMIVKTSQENRRKRLAALRVFIDDDGSTAATLYLPTETWRWKLQGTEFTSGGGNWELRSDPEVNPWGVVPVVPFLNRPRLDPWGYSELLGVIPIQDAVNKLVADMMVASEYAALPQRWATGLEIQRDPVTNRAIDPFPPVARLLQTEDRDAAFGQFNSADLGTYVTAIEMLIQHAASQSSTPPHYFFLRGEFPSGESINSAEAGLVRKAIDRTRTFGESHEEVQRLAFLVSGDIQRARQMKAETQWADVAIRSEAEHVDAALKKKSLDVPREQLWEDLGYTPQQIARFHTLIGVGTDTPTDQPLVDA